MKNLGEVFISEFVRVVPRKHLIMTIRFTGHDDLYEAARLELRHRDTERIRRDWIQVMTGRAC